MLAPTLSWSITERYPASVALGNIWYGLVFSPSHLCPLIYYCSLELDLWPARSIYCLSCNFLFLVEFLLYVLSFLYLLVIVTFIFSCNSPWFLELMYFFLSCNYPSYTGISSPLRIIKEPIQTLRTTS